MLVTALLSAAAAQAQERVTMLRYIVDKQPALGDLVVKAGLAPMLSGNEVYTFLVPSEGALASLQQASPERLRAILSGHILKGKYLERDLKDGAILKTLAGTSITICRKKDYTLVSGQRITSANVEVQNGVIHNLSGTINL